MIPAAHTPSYYLTDEAAAQRMAKLVHRITEGEAVRDVTADLIPEDDEAPEYPEWEREASRGDRLYQERMEGVRP